MFLLILSFNIGVCGCKSYVICTATEKKVYQKEPGCKEWVTVLETIYGEGTSTSPLVIFKGDNLQTSWIPLDMTGDWSWSSNKKGWTCNAIGDD